MPNPQVIKTISLLLLSIPFLLLLTYQPPSSFNLNYYTHSLSKYNKMDTIIDDVYLKINHTIEENKLGVLTKEEESACLFFTKLADQGEVAGVGQCQFCGKGWVEQDIADVVYFHIFVDKDRDGFNQEVATFSQQLSQHLKTEIHILWQVLDKSVLPQHLKDKIHDQTYTKLIAQQFSSMRQAKNCRYTHRNCQTYTLLLTNWPNLETEYVRTSNVVFSGVERYRETIIGVLGGECLSADGLARVFKVKRLMKIRRQLNGIEKLMGNLMVEPDLKQLAVFVDQVHFFLNGSQQQVPTILNDLSGVTINLFPTEYKLGVYLPIFLIMIVFPFCNVVKL